MKKRIGNDIQFTWHIYRKSGETQTPESFDGKEVEVKLISPLQRPVTIEDVTIATGVVTFTFRGKHQVTLGNYVAVLQENKGENGMVTLDVVDAVTLVPHSYMEEDGDEGDVIEATSVELTSEIGQGIDAYTKAESDEKFVHYGPNKKGISFLGNEGDLDYTAIQPNGVRVGASNTDDGTSYVRFVDITADNIELRSTRQVDPDEPVIRQTSVVWHDEFDEVLAGKQDLIQDLAAIRSGAQAGATAYPKPSTGIPATDLASDVQSDIAAIDGIKAVIPEQASSSNQLADKDFVNSSIATSTATYRGAYNLVTDLQLSVSATHAEIATALATAIQTADNNDYCFVQIPTEDATPTEIARIDRYKYDGTAWAYEYSLNNSGFTAAQWAAINSGITSGLVAKLSALPTNSELTALLSGKADATNLIPVDSIWQWSNTAYLRATDIQTLDGVWIDKSATSATKEKYIYINKLSSNLLVYTDRYYNNSFNAGFVIPKGQQMIRDENMTSTSQTALLHIPYSGLLSLWMGTPSKSTASDQYVEILDSENNVIKHYSSYTLSKLNSPIILKVNSGNYYIRYHWVNFFFCSAMLVRYELPLSELLDDETHRVVTDAEKTIWNNKSDFSGSYNDLTDKPTIPDITGKADKVSNATNGNFASLDSNGNLRDSGHKHSDYLTQHQDLSNYVQKSQTTGLLKNDGTVDTTQYLTQHQDISGKANTADLAEVATSGSYNDLSNKPDLSAFITKSVDDLMNYYLKSETYTKTEVQQLIGAIQQFHYEVYPSLPQTGASNVLYLIGPTGTGTDKYEEYVYANNDWAKIGDTSIDLSGYVTTQALTTALADYVTSSALSVTLSNYVNKNEVDDVPTANSKNPVTSGGVYDALLGEYVVATAAADTGSVATAMIGIYDVNDVLIVEGEGEVTARILYGKTYKVKCSRIYDYLTPAEQTFTASIPSRQVTMQYTYIERDVVTLDQTISDSAQMLSGDIQGNVIKEIRSHSHLYLGTPATQSGDTEGTELLCQLSDEDSRLYYDGTPAALDGSEGDQWLKLPVFWWKVVGVGEAAADGAHDQYRLMFAFAGEPDPSWNKWQGDRNLVGAKEMKVVNNIGRSVSDGQSTGSFTQAQGNAYAAARNLGCQQVTWEWQWIMCVLFYAWYGNTDSQEMCGIGSNSYTRTLGVTDQLGMTDTTPAQATSLTSARFWGLEAWWNCKAEWMGNAVMENHVLHITDQDTKQTRQVSGFIQCGGTGGFNSRMRIDANGDFVPLAKAGTQTTFYCDYVNSNSGSRVLYRSRYNASAYGGVAYVDAYNAPSGAYAHIGSRLAFNGVITEAESVAAYKAALA